MAVPHVLVSGLLPGVNGVSSAVMSLHRHIDPTEIIWDFLYLKESTQKHKDYIRDHPNYYFQEDIKAKGGTYYVSSYNFRRMTRTARKEYEQLLIDHDEIEGVYEVALGLNHVAPVYYSHKVGKPLNVLHAHTGPNYLEENAGRTLYRGSRRLIASDDFLRLACSDNAGYFHYGPNLSFEFFPNAIELNTYRFQPVLREPTRLAAEIDDDIDLIIMLGTIYDVKNPIFALDVFEEYLKINPKAIFGYVGSLNEKDAANNALERGEAFYDYVRFFGAHAKPNIFLSAADALIMPSKSEGFPNVLVEAQASGLPCITSTNITPMVKLTDLVEQYSLTDDSPEVWAKALHRMIRANKNNRRSRTEELKAQGFDAVDAAKKLTDMFLERIERGHFDPKASISVSR